MLITRTVSNTGSPFCTPSGAPIVGATINFTLVNTNGMPVDAWDAVSGDRVVGEISATTDTNGEFSVVLWPNDRGAIVTQYLCNVSTVGAMNFYASVPSGLTTLPWIVFMAQGTTLTPSQISALEYSANKDVSGGYVGLTGMAINFWNSAKTFLSHFTNSNTAARTYTFQDRNGIIADDTDLALKAPIASPTFTGTVGGVTSAMVGLGNVDNTSDVNKPVSTAQASMLDTYLSFGALMRKYGTNMHLYLPGIGYTNGLDAGNYLDAAGTTLATVNNPVGLVLDAAGSLGPELVSNGTFDTDTSGWAATSATFISTNGIARLLGDASGYGVAAQSITTVVGKTYVLCGIVTGFGGGADASIGVQIFGVNYSDALFSVGIKFVAVGTTTSVLLQVGVNLNGAYKDFDNISVREVTGIHLSQATTANKPILALTNGKYNWTFDTTDQLTATFPAGNESVTVIDATAAGQVTTIGVNVVGSYSIGPSLTTYGRMIINGSITAPDLLLLQNFANKLAGL